MPDALRALLILLTCFLAIGATMIPVIANTGQIGPVLAIVLNASWAGLLADWVPHKPRFMGWPVRIVALVSAGSALAAGVALFAGWERLSIGRFLILIPIVGAGLGIALGLAVRWLPRRNA